MFFIEPFHDTCDNGLRSIGQFPYVTNVFQSAGTYLEMFIQMKRNVFSKTFRQGYTPVCRKECPIRFQSVGYPSVSLKQSKDKPSDQMIGYRRKGEIDTGFVNADSKPLQILIHAGACDIENAGGLSGIGFPIIGRYHEGSPYVV